MSWIEITLPTSAETAETAGEAMEAAGAAAVTFGDEADEPLYEPEPGTTPMWRRTRVVGLFPADVDRDAVLAELGRAHPLPADTTIRKVVDREWTRAWMDHFRPMRFGERLWICPTDHPAPETDGLIIRLDPGLAFGSGTHPTTRLCLEWLDANPPTHQRVIDYGCGSGILAVAAALLGARSVLGVDHDNQAIQATRANAELNGVGSAIDACRNEDEGDPHGTCVLANILAGPLRELAPHLAGMVEPGGRIALSGILEEQAADVAESYAPWFDLNPPTVLDGWVRLDGTRK
jgi:ribosomal protein L11 methyltransferase